MSQSTRNSRLIRASPEKIYKALTTPEALETWQAPGNMTGKVHSFDLSVGRGYTMSLFYADGETSTQGKTDDKEDRFSVRFAELDPPHKIVQAVLFDTDDTRFSGEMMMEITLTPANDGTEVVFSFSNIPTGIKPADNEAGTESSLEKLAKYVED